MCFSCVALRAFCSIIQMISMTMSFLMTCFLPRIDQGEKGLRCLYLLRGAVCLAHPLSSEVWNSLIILSYLSALLPGVDANIVGEIRSMVPKRNNIIDSDVMLYTPNLDIFAKEKGCECFFMWCYLLELKVYQAENNLSDFNTTIAYLEHIEHSVSWKSARSDCSPCEAQPIANISTFFTSLNETLNRCNLGDIDCFCIEMEDYS